ncbi:TlpA family protein disulfide reductase [Chitinophaga qingshengii]|uniref:Redoxin domain-containing protein n=1 Tax=Chitinophaga qingshengii TaxID=1569794 RepID=A0ABR7TZK0_9BACT|nr:redoxin domain-containing protein [Chitinophaga qingshengii]MBC9934809.1 redoxin domain-containing protein [Chitinophaga qingshengii]
MQCFRKLSLLFSVGFLMMQVSAQTVTTISGRVKGGNGQRISVSWWNEPGISAAMSLDSLIQKDSFCFRLPAVPAPALFFYLDAGGSHNFYGTLHPGDSISLTFGEDTLVVAGRGAVACRVQYLTRRAQDRIPPPQLEDAASKATWYQQQLLVAENMLRTYHDSLPPTLYTVVRANVLGETAAKIMGCLWQASPGEEQALLYQRVIRPALPAIVPSDTTALAIRYLNYLLQKAEADYVMQQHSQCTEKDIYEWIKTHYSGLLRDKLLAHQLLQSLAAGGQQEELASCAQDYLSIVQHAVCKQAIAAKYSKIRKGISKGMPAPAFSFPDSSGHPVNLRYFAGKVVLLHFYNAEDPLLPSLSEINTCFNKDEVVFIHINCNNNVSARYPGVQWQAGDQVAGVLEQYNISQYPALIVVGKNGNIYATKPPDPTADHGAALADIIYAALLQ